MSAAPIVQVASPITILIDGKAREFSSLQALAERFAEMERSARLAKIDLDMARLSLSAVAKCETCRDRHCCGASGATPPECTTGGAVLTWQPWTSEDIERIGDHLRAEIAALRSSNGGAA